MASSIKMLSECPVCYDEMIPPMKIFQCINGHSLCENCKDNENLTTCPSCRVSLRGNAMSRNILAESLIEAEMNKGHNEDNGINDDFIPSAPPVEDQDGNTDVTSFLARINLSELTEIFKSEELGMDDVLNLSNEELKDIGVKKMKHRKLILQETQMLLRSSGFNEEKNRVAGNPKPHAHWIKVKEKMIKTPAPLRPVKQQSASDPPFILVSSRGPAADHQSWMFGLYRKSEEMREGRSVYTQEHDTEHEDIPGKLSSDQGVWRITWEDTWFLKAATPSVSPTSVTWQFYDFDLNTWRDDPALTVIGLSETEYDYVKQRTGKDESNEVNEEDSEEEEGAESLEILPYFHGAIDRAQAESRLKDEQIGTFLVRFENIILK